MSLAQINSYTLFVQYHNQIFNPVAYFSESEKEVVPLGYILQKNTAMTWMLFSYESLLRPDCRPVEHTRGIKC